MSGPLLVGDKEHVLRNHGLMIFVQSPQLMSLIGSTTFSETMYNETNFPICYLI